jgi:hypothetical protein
VLTRNKYEYKWEMEVAENLVGLFQKIIRLYGDWLWGSSSLLSNVYRGRGSFHLCEMEGVWN